MWEAAEQYDHKGNGARMVYATVGIGNEEYRQAVEALRAKAAARRAARKAVTDRQKIHLFRGPGSRAPEQTFGARAKAPIR